MGSALIRRGLFQLHSLLGLAAGLVLVVLGVTGALYSFQLELLELLNPPPTAATPDRRPLTLPEVRQRLLAPGQELSFVSSMAGEGYGLLGLAPVKGQGRGEVQLFDRYTGEVLTAPRGQGFFRLILDLHRSLALGPVGKALTGAATLILLVLCLSGLYLRWPRQVRRWRTWLTLDWRRQGRSFHWDLHAVAGTWCLLLYLLAALTGLYWSYGWYREAGERLLGAAPEPRISGVVARQDVDLDALWRSFRQETGGRVEGYGLLLPNPARKVSHPTLWYLPDDAEHVRALNRIVFDSAGRVLDHRRYREQPLGARLLLSVYALHSGEYFGLAGRVALLLASLAMPLFMVTGLWLYLDRRRKRRQARQAQSGLTPAAAGAADWLIGYASQSGQGEALAWQAASQLQAAGLSAEVVALGRLSVERLQRATRALFVVATHGDGEAPDAARGFERRLLTQAAALPGLNYGLLALGDRRYPAYCAFAQRLDTWLGGQGARPLFAPVEVDNGDAQALALWQAQLQALGAARAEAPPERPLQSWQLASVQRLNAGSPGGAVFELQLLPPPGSSWAPGDILEIAPRQRAERVAAWLSSLGLAADSVVTREGFTQTLAVALETLLLPEDQTALRGLDAQALLDTLKPLAVRQYSIASLPGERPLRLLVRQARKTDGRLGIASGWLTTALQPGDVVEARLRVHPGFRPPLDERPLILIAAGTGLAGVRPLLAARIAAGHRRNWLLFGERTAAHDDFYGTELQAWQARGELARLDRVFSRDGDGYVQDRLRAQRELLLDWLAADAVIMVCGSLPGLGRGVQATLQALLGEAEVQRLIDQDRYRRDLY
ncbi:sulfite reductase (NADPH) flavoprotein alpha-component [Pseudomonas oryzihabitans]|uniref:Sulfite reductase flavoprotein subunit alpha n=1 Tax=Pseudomonas flavocrustae TaxID=2991719 RepID=A0ABT6IKG5_9PSED|nr:sulfite reductase flavoprotein subunit alpha [Pseudomonas sp. CBMAI 2609]MDH4764972.1 sulfite reductase flavoprotein subunit alpha [Pseudomonas sp. CBMAI 2609]